MTVRYFQPRLGAFHQLTFWSNIVNADYFTHTLLLSPQLKRPECRGCNNTRTDTLTFLWNPSQSFFFEHFSTKTPLLAFKLLVTFHGSEQTTGEIIKIFVTLSHPLKSGPQTHFTEMSGWMSSILLYRLRKWSPSLHIIIAPKTILFTMRLEDFFAQTFFILISPLIWLNSRHTHNVIFICWKLLKFVLV